MDGWRQGCEREGKVRSQTHTPREREHTHGWMEACVTCTVCVHYYTGDARQRVQERQAEKGRRDP